MRSAKVSRRNMMAQLGAGIAATAMTAGVAEAQTGGNSGGGSTAAPFVDPKSKYPKPPYPGRRSRGRGWRAR